MNNELEERVPPCMPREFQVTLYNYNYALDFQKCPGRPAFMNLKEELPDLGDRVFKEAVLELLANYDIQVSELSSFVSSVYPLLSCPV